MSENSEEEEVQEEVVEVEKYYYFTREAVILPNNERTQELAQRRAKENRLKKMQEEEEERAHLESIKKRREEEENYKKMKLALEEKKRLDEIREQEELNQLSELKGTFGNLVKDLKDHNTNLELSQTGVDFGNVQYRVIFKAIEQNQSVKVLSINRKKISDDEGIELCKSQQYNNSLERLDLESNNLGPKFCEQLAVTITKNTMLRSIDIEGNNLTNGNDENGIMALAESQKHNDTLLCLNLNSCNLTKSAGKALKEAIMENNKLISLDIERNSFLDHEDVIDIQNKLQENCKEYRGERKREWQERRNLIKEEGTIKEILKARGSEIAIIDEIRKEAEMSQLKREEIFLTNVFLFCKTKKIDGGE